MQPITLTPIGNVQNTQEGALLKLLPQYRPALLGLTGFSHVQVLWWCNGFADEAARSTLAVPQPYKNAPATLGIFATRSPIRPNPLALSAVQVIKIEEEAGLIYLTYIDADDGTPILDIKPYTPSMDRIEAPATPAWCAHWPKSLESSAQFAWEDEFTF